jgi:hypothetical protein
MTTLIEDRRSDETTSTVARANSLLDSRLRTRSSPTPERGGRRSKVQERPRRLSRVYAAVNQVITASGLAKGGENKLGKSRNRGCDRLPDVREGKQVTIILPEPKLST